MEKNEYKGKITIYKNGHTMSHTKLFKLHDPVVDKISQVEKDLKDKYINVLHDYTMVFSHIDATSGVFIFYNSKQMVSDTYVIKYTEFK